MAKAMLIMDIPSSCVKCPVVNELGSIYVCGKNGKVIESGYAVQREEWCPLREVPQKPDYPPINENSYVAGYNACIDEILGGSE